VKELRLAGISTIEAANAWVPAFMVDYNTRFGRAPENAKDLHRKLTKADDLSEVLAWREERTVTKNLTLHYDRMMLLLDPTPLARGLVRKTVDVVNYPDGRFAVQFEGVSLSFRKFDKIQTVEPGEIVENKRLGAALAMVKQHQDTYEPHHRRYHPARQRPPNNLEAPGQPTKGRPSRPWWRGNAARPRLNPDDANHARRLFLRPAPSVPRCSLQGKSGARRPRAEVDAARGSGQLCSSHLLPSAALRVPCRCQAGTGKQAHSTELESCSGGGEGVTSTLRAATFLTGRKSVFPIGDRQRGGV